MASERDADACGRREKLSDTINVFRPTVKNLLQYNEVAVGCT
jgi:hypothetical protein